MIRKEIIELAREAASVYSTTTNFFHLSPNQLEHFANLVAAKERERCAVICETLWDRSGDECAANIRSLK